MNLDQKPSPLWWTHNIRTVIYFLRELTGPIIAIYIVYSLWLMWGDPLGFFSLQPHFRIMGSLAFVASIIHSVTWFWVTVKISPVPPAKIVQAFGFLFLIAVWLLFSVMAVYSPLFYPGS